MKNVIYAAIIGVCVVVAGIVFVATRSGDSSPGLTDETQIWVKCARCGATYQMGEKSYYDELHEKATANPTAMMITPPLTCEKCGKDGIRKAVKCESCGEVFFEGAVPNDFSDRCPKCKHSATEAKREARKREMTQR
jgi:hypothetical protein